MDQNTFTATDQREREIIWSALCDYRNTYPESTEVITDMILRVSNTFEWVRNENGV